MIDVKGSSFVMCDLKTGIRKWEKSVPLNHPKLVCLTQEYVGVVWFGALDDFEAPLEIYRIESGETKFSQKFPSLG